MEMLWMPLARLDFGKKQNMDNYAAHGAHKLGSRRIIRCNEANYCIQLGEKRCTDFMNANYTRIHVVLGLNQHVRNGMGP